MYVVLALTPHFTDDFGLLFRPIYVFIDILNQDPDFAEPLLIDTYPRPILQMQVDDRPINADDGSTDGRLHPL